MVRGGKKSKPGLLLVTNRCAKNSLCKIKKKSVFIHFALSSSDVSEQLQLQLNYIIITVQKKYGWYINYVIYIVGEYCM